MPQDATRYGGRPQPRGLCVRWGPSPPPQKVAEPQIRGPRLLRPNGCMDQDATWYGGRPRPRRHCVRWGPSSPSQKGTEPQFSAHFYCGKTAGCIKMPLGTKVGLSPGDFVLDGDPAPSRKRGGAHNFRPTSIVPNGCMDQDATWYGGRLGLCDIVLDGDPAPRPLNGHRSQLLVL